MSVIEIALQLGAEHSVPALIVDLQGTPYILTGTTRSAAAMGGLWVTYTTPDGQTHEIDAFTARDLAGDLDEHADLFDHDGNEPTVPVPDARAAAIATAHAEHVDSIVADLLPVFTAWAARTTYRDASRRFAAVLTPDALRALEDAAWAALLPR